MLCPDFNKPCITNSCIAYTEDKMLMICEICEICEQTFYRGFSCKEKGHKRQPKPIESYGTCLKYNKTIRTRI